MKEEERQYWERFKDAYYKALRSRGITVPQPESIPLTASPIGDGANPPGVAGASSSVIGTISSHPVYTIPWRSLVRQHTSTNTDRPRQTDSAPTSSLNVVGAERPSGGSDGDCRLCADNEFLPADSRTVHPHLTVSAKARRIFGASP